MSMNQEDIIRWLAGGGRASDIFGAPGGQQTMPWLSEEDRDYINDRGITMARANSIMADPWTRASLGAGPGGYGPETFESTYTYEPVKAPAYMKLMQMQGSNDAVSRIIAEVMLNKGTAFEAENAVLAAMEDETSPDYQELRSTPALWDSGRPGQPPTPNASRLQRITSDIETLALNDPVFNAIDPATGQPANVVDENGNPIRQQEDNSWVREIETQGIGAREFERLGLYNPYETYDRDQFVDQSVLEQEAAAVRALQEAMTRYNLNTEAYNDGEGPVIDAEVARLTEEMYRDTDPGEVAPGTPHPSESVPASSAPEVGGVSENWLTDAILDSAPDAPEEQEVWDFQSATELRDPIIRDRRRQAGNSTTRGQPGRSPGTDPNAIYNRVRDQVQGRARHGLNLDKADMYRRSGNVTADRYQQQRRDAFVRYLWEQGHSPYGDQMRDINAQVYGGF